MVYCVTSSQLMEIDITVVIQIKIYFVMTMALGLFITYIIYNIPVLATQPMVLFGMVLIAVK